MTTAEVVLKLVASLKASQLQRSTAASFKTNITAWLDGLARYGARDWGSNREDIRAKALWFDLSRREFADLINTYVAASAFAAVRARSHSSEAVICGHCNHLTWASDQSRVEDDETVCSACIANYYTACGNCGHYRLGQVDGRPTFVAIQRVALICPSCFESGRQVGRYGQCEGCRLWFQSDRGGLYSYDDAGENDPEGSHHYCNICRVPEKSRCKPKTPQFDFPVLCLGEGQVMHSGEIKEITIGGGDVSSSGMRAIYDAIYNKTRGEEAYGVSISRLLEPERFDPSWVTKEGNMPKRIAKILLTDHHLKLTEDLMAELGNIAKAYTTKPSVQRVRLDRVIGHDRHDYINDNSCWWTDYWYSRCTLKSLGGMAVRCYNEEGTESTARGWLIPLQFDDYKWQPQPDLGKATGYVVFNVYDRSNRLEAMHFGRMIAQMTGKSYKRLGLAVHNMYVNGGDRANRPGYSGSVLIAEQSLCEQTTGPITIRAIPNKCTCGVSS